MASKPPVASASSPPIPAGYDDWSPEQKAFYQKYKKLPKQNELLMKKDKKHFDSADWAKNINNKGRTFSQ